MDLGDLILSRQLPLGFKGACEPRSHLVLDHDDDRNPTHCLRFILIRVLSSTYFPLLLFEGALTLVHALVPGADEPPLHWLAHPWRTVSQLQIFGRSCDGHVGQR